MIKVDVNLFAYINCKWLSIYFFSQTCIMTVFIKRFAQRREKKHQLTGLFGTKDTLKPEIGAEHRGKIGLLMKKRFPCLFDIFHLIPEKFKSL